MTLEEYREIARRCKATEACAAIIGLISRVQDLQQTINDLEEEANETKAQNKAMLEALKQAAMELEEAANVLENSLPSLASVYQTAAESKRAIIKAAQ